MRWTSSVVTSRKQTIVLETTPEDVLLLSNGRPSTHWLKEVLDSWKIIVLEVPNSGNTISSMRPAWIRQQGVKRAALKTSRLPSRWLPQLSRIREYHQDVVPTERSWSVQITWSSPSVAKRPSSLQRLWWESLYLECLTLYVKDMDQTLVLVNPFFLLQEHHPRDPDPTPFSLVSSLPIQGSSFMICHLICHHTIYTDTCLTLEDSQDKRTIMYNPVMLYLRVILNQFPIKWQVSITKSSPIFKMC